MLESFLNFIYGDEVGKVYVPTKKEDGTWSKANFLWPAQKAKIISHIKEQAPVGDVYVSPSLFKGNVVTKDGFKSSSVVWVDLDGNYDGNFHGLPQPNLIVQSSKGTNVHCYWKLDQVETDPTALELINRRLAVHLSADPSGWDCTQLLRPPETTNHKHGLPVETKRLVFSPTARSEFDFLENITFNEVTYADIEWEDAPALLKVYPSLNGFCGWLRTRLHL